MLPRIFGGPSRLLLAGAVLCAAALAQEVSLYVTSRAGDRFAQKPPLMFTDRPAQDPIYLFRVNPSVRYQRIDGFGASLLEAGLICLNSLEPSAQEDVLRALFDLQTGAGFSVMKTVMAGTDFMSSGPWYTYDDTPGDVELKHFSIERDLGPNGLITYIRRARKYGRFRLQSPMDYPPDWMLVDANKDQNINPKCYDALARYQLRYLQEYANQDITIDYLAPFNEPMVYTKIPYEQIGTYIRDYLGPALDKAGLKTKIQFSDLDNRGHFYEAVMATMQDPEVRKYVGGFSFHGYRHNNFDKLAEVYRRYPEVPLWQTEVCILPPGVQQPPSDDWEEGDFWGNAIFNDLEAFASAWIYWNMILDEKGGPWLVSQIHNDPDNNIQGPVVLIDRQQKRVKYLPLYYYLAHFSKFVRPGAYRVQTSGSAYGIRIMSFRSGNDTIVTELLNSRPEAAGVTLEIGGRFLLVDLPAKSIATCSWKI